MRVRPTLTQCPDITELLNKSGNIHHLRSLMEHNNKHLYYTGHSGAGFLLPAAHNLALTTASNCLGKGSLQVWMGKDRR